MSAEHEQLDHASVENLETLIYREALDYLDAGHDSFSGLYDHCLANTPLDEVARYRGHEAKETLMDIIESPGLIRVGEHADLVVRTSELLEGLVLTHRLTGEELQRGMVEVEPDLGEVATAASLTLSQGGLLDVHYDWGDTEDYHPGGSLVGPNGWLTRFTPGDLLAFRLRRGGLELMVVADPGPGHTEQQALLRAFDEALAGRQMVGIHTSLLVDEALMADRTLFRAPVLPVSELLEAAGLEVRDGWSGRRGEDWEPAWVIHRIDEAARFAHERELDDCCVSGFVTVVGYTLGRGMAPGEVNAALSHGEVADTFVDWWLDTWAIESPRFARTLQPLLTESGRDQAGARYLMAVHHDSRGEALAAESQLEGAIQANPGYRPALWMLAGYAADRGDAGRAVALWRRSGADPEEEPLAFHEDLLASVARVGRNEPCPCGSGRKYKQCHLHDIYLPEPARVTWLMSKISRHLHSHDRHQALVGLLVDSLGSDIDADRLWDLTSDDFVNDIAMFEDGGLERFIEERAVLLPDEEVAMARRWSGVPFRCWEVRTTDQVAKVVLKDASGEETVEVHDPEGAGTLDPGELILTRALPGREFHYPSPAGLIFESSWRERLVALLDDYPSPEGWLVWYQVLFGEEK